MTRMPQTGIHAVTVPGRGGGVGETERALRPAAARRRARAGRSASRTKVSRSRKSRPPSGMGSEAPARRCRGGTRVPARRPAAARRRGVPQPRPRKQLPADRGRGPRRVLRRRDRAAHRRAVPHGTAARWRRRTWPSTTREWVAPISTAYRGWTVYELPPNGQGIAALMMLNLLEQVSDRALRAQLGRRAAHADRGEEAGLRRHGPAPGRPGLPRGAGGVAAVEGVRRAAARARSIRGARTRASRRATCRRAAATRPT